MLLVRLACGGVAEQTPLSCDPKFQRLLQHHATSQLSKEDKDKERKHKMHELLRMRENRRAPAGMHSRIGVDIRAKRKSRTEIIVNHSYQAFPAYRISYQLSQEYADPLGQGSKDLCSFDDYKSSPFHTNAVVHGLV